ncbi:MAG: OmpA family protein [Candidatus Rokubacteria bacterium]|nr:OmpA family protein [Candidatus Rokubacteria bacterium]
MIRPVLMSALAGALVLASACATKEFVREEVQTVRAGLAQERERVGGIVSQVDEVRVQVREVGTQLTDVRSLADDARSRAGEATSAADRASQAAVTAFAKAEATDRRLSRLWANRNKRAVVETLTVTFGFDKWELDDRAQTDLLDVVKQLKENAELVVDLEGHTDMVGPIAYNLQLSQRRVDAVRRFLFGHGIDLPRVQTIGLGSAHPIADNASAEGRARNRRVAVRLFTPAE